MNLTQKTVLVTGASDGIGRSIAIRLAKEKTRLILFGRDEQKLQSVQKDCEQIGVTAEAYAFDLTDRLKRNDALQKVLQSHQLDVVINNAGIWHKVDDLTSLPEEKIEEVISVNLTAQILLTRAVLENMRKRETAIINVISKSGLVAQARQAVYTAAKFGMKGFTNVLREDTKEEPIRIGAIYQAGTATEMFAKAGDDFPVEKFTHPDDLAEVVVFMLTRPPKIWLNELHITY